MDGVAGIELGREGVEGQKVLIFEANKSTHHMYNLCSKGKKKDLKKVSH